MKNYNTKKLLVAGFLIMITASSFAQSADAIYVPKDPKTDNLLTGENTVLLVIDWQPDLIKVVRNID